MESTLGRNQLTYTVNSLKELLLLQFEKEDDRHNILYGTSLWTQN